jgi:Response regulator containing CheY-like receiver domain and AraC-type DNA-binding domain
MTALVSAPPIRILIVDDETLARQRLRMLLDRRKDFEIVGECSSGAEAVRVIRDEKPDMVLLDVQMPELDGFDVIAEVGAHNMPIVIFATAFDDYAIDAFEVGAVDYLLKPVDEERLNRTLDRASRRCAKKGTIHRRPRCPP